MFNNLLNEEILRTSGNVNSELLSQALEEKTLIKDLFSGVEGTKVLSILCRECFSDLGNYEKDATKSSYRAGQISIIMYILKACNVPAETFLSLVQSGSGCTLNDINKLRS